MHLELGIDAELKRRIPILYQEPPMYHGKVKVDPIPMVLVEFPKMNAPFSSCMPFVDPIPTEGANPKKATKKRKVIPLIHSLTVNFKSEEKSPAIQEFRTFQGAIFDRLVTLCGDRDAANGKVWKQDAKVPVEPLIKVSDEYPDKMVLKFLPGAATFEGERGEVLQEEDIEWDDMDVQPVAQLRDLWKYKGTYFPRYFLVHCKVTTRL